MKKRTDYKICEYCGAALDPGEKCDCIGAQNTTPYNGKGYIGAYRKEQGNQKETRPYNKISACIYPYKYGCKGCKYNGVSELFNGGCMLVRTARKIKKG